MSKVTQTQSKWTDSTKVRHMTTLVNKWLLQLNKWFLPNAIIKQWIGLTLIKSPESNIIMELIRAFLNLMCVSLSMVCKVPQLRFHINSRSTQVNWFTKDLNLIHIYQIFLYFNEDDSHCFIRDSRGLPSSSRPSPCLSPSLTSPPTATPPQTTSSTRSSSHR